MGSNYLSDSSFFLFFFVHPVFRSQLYFFRSGLRYAEAPRLKMRCDERRGRGREGRRPSPPPRWSRAAARPCGRAAAPGEPRARSRLERAERDRRWRFAQGAWRRSAMLDSTRGGASRAKDRHLAGETWGRREGLPWSPVGALVRARVGSSILRVGRDPRSATVTRRRGATHVAGGVDRRRAASRSRSSRFGGLAGQVLLSAAGSAGRAMKKSSSGPWPKRSL